VSALTAAAPPVRAEAGVGELSDAKQKPDTRTAFLDEAERLFAEHGYAGMRIRDIANAANANLSALHYYWGNKEALIQELCERRMGPVVEERLRRFALLERSLREKRQDRIAALLRDHLEPFAELLAASPREQFQSFYTRMAADPAPEVREVSTRLMEEMSRQFVRMLRAMCDHLDDAAFFWRLNGVLGTVLHVQAFGFRTRRYVEITEERADLAEGIDEIVRFLTAALIAPPARPG